MSYIAAHNISATLFHVRYRESLPDGELCDYARRGMWTHGVATEPFYWVDDVVEKKDLSPTVGVAGFIGDVHAALRTIGRPIPENVDYPVELNQFLGRSIDTATMYEVRSMIDPIFIKPKEHKLFTGLLWTGDIESRAKTVTVPDDTELWTSSPVEFVSEYRAFIINDVILDVRLYRGDWSKAPDRSVIERAVLVHREAGSPSAYCCDWGVTSLGSTLLVERNEGYSFGHYGLKPPDYARMLSTRWFEMAGGLE